MSARKLLYSAVFIGLFTLALGFTPLVFKQLNLAAEETKPEAVKENLKHVNALSQAFQYTAKTLRPSVVSVLATQKNEVIPARRNPNDLLRDFFGEDGAPVQPPPRRGFRGMPPGQGQMPGQESVAQGTGVIVSKDGFILTNNHVVDKADRLMVRLSTGREYLAKVIGTDKKTDLAVIQIKATDLTPADLGDSDKLEVGEWVLAIGSPFGLDQTVTAGIVSAKSRNNVGVTDYEDFIQTDAAINPGNSGGPLVNLEGKVVGINTAIATRTGGYMGIGFSIPISQAQQIMNSLVKDGRVSRGRLGVMIQDMNGDLARSFNFEGRGVLVGGVEKESPAALAGVKPGDIITRFNGREVSTVVMLRNMVASVAPGTKTAVELVREGKPMTLQIATVEMEKATEVAAKETTKAAPTDLGMEVLALTPRQAKRHDVNEGVVVTTVEANSLAEQSGVKVGDLIMAVGKEPVITVADFTALVKKQDLSKGFRMQLKTEGITRYVFIKADE